MWLSLPTLVYLLVDHFGLSAHAALPAQPALRRLPTGAVTPSGWLLKQLVLQAEGLSGHLTKFWPRVRDSAWFGGAVPSYLANNSCGAAPCPMNISQSQLLHQEAPYFMNGFVPLAYLLKNAGVEQLPPRGPGLPTIKPLEQAQHYVNYILDHNGSSPCGATAPCAPPPPGWLGPFDIGLAGAMYWGSFPALLALQQHAEADAAAFNRTSLAMADVGPTFCQVCPSDLPCFGPAFPLPSNGSCKVGIDLCGGDISRDGIMLPAAAQPTDCEAACKKHNVGLKRGVKPCEAYVFAKGNASASKAGPTCYLKQAPGAFLPQGKCGNSSFWNRGTMANFCAGSLRPLDTCYNMSNVKRGSSTGSISFQRWIDLAYSILWVLNTEGAAHGHETELRALLKDVQLSGQDWDTHFKGPIGGTHNVNLAQGLKSAAINFLLSDGSVGSAEHYAGLSRERMAHLDSNFGLPTGMYVGDEHLPPTPDRNPGRGIETCGVVESMFSYSTMYATHGDTRFADRAEKIAFNALPATWFSPRGGEMWAHQYFQAVNEINAIGIPGFHGTKSPVYTYGIDNFPCCTANFHQGWPKFANALFHTNETKGFEGIVVSMYAPASATTRYGNITVVTEYPFGDNATIKVEATAATSLYLRVPGWASEARILELKDAELKNGTIVRLPLPKGLSTVHIIFIAKVRLETDGLEATYDGQKGTLSYSVHRGPILYSLNLEPKWNETTHYYAGSNDYSVTTSAPWAFALDQHSLKFVHNGYNSGTAPFNRSGWPAHVEATARPLGPKAWPLDKAKWLPTVPPASPACAKPGQCGAPQPVQLVPHGGTALRIGTLPLSGADALHKAHKSDDNAAVASPDPLEAEIQDYIDQLARNFSIGVGVGYVDAHGRQLSLGAGGIGVDGTVVLGSGTKPYVAAAVMRLVERGVVVLDDKAMEHVDVPLRSIWGTSFVALFGPMAADVTVEQLMRHTSGLGDFDEVSSYEDGVLQNFTANPAHAVHDPMEDMLIVANFSEPFGCTTRNCTWVFAPGSGGHLYYSSLNFILSGLVLLAHAPAQHNSWRTMDMPALLGFKPEQYQHTFFPALGALNTSGLSTVGYTGTDFGGPTTVFSQDASIMGFCYGYVVASAGDVARFYWAMLNPAKAGTVLSLKSVKAMTTWDLIDRGWGAGRVLYGIGLELECATNGQGPGGSGEKPCSSANLTAGIGHAGTTYGFQSINHYYPHLERAISITLNCDSGWSAKARHSSRCIAKRIIMCNVLRIALRHQGAGAPDVQCAD